MWANAGSLALIRSNECKLWVLSPHALDWRSHERATGTSDKPPCEYAGSGGSIAPPPSIKSPTHLNTFKPPMHYASMGSNGHARVDDIPRVQTWASDITSSTRRPAGSPLRGTASAVAWGSGEDWRPMTAGGRNVGGQTNVKLA